MVTIETIATAGQLCKAAGVTLPTQANCEDDTSGASSSASGATTATSAASAKASGAASSVGSVGTSVASSASMEGSSVASSGTCLVSMSVDLHSTDEIAFSNCSSWDKLAISFAKRRGCPELGIEDGSRRCCGGRLRPFVIDETVATDNLQRNQQGFPYSRWLSWARKEQSDRTRVPCSDVRASRASEFHGWRSRNMYDIVLQLLLTDAKGASSIESSPETFNPHDECVNHQ